MRDRSSAGTPCTCPPRFLGPAVIHEAGCPSAGAPTDKAVLHLAVTRHKGGTWEVAARRADGSTARRRGLPAYDNAWFAVEDELDAMLDYLEPDRG